MARSQHRVVIFADGAERANQVLPFTSYDSAHEENLWRYLARYEDQTGGRVISIPHNSNLTGGHMFAELDSFARPLTPDYAKTRARFEPIVEITQIKGDSETHPLLSPDDEFANFERWNNWNGWGELTTDQVGIDLRQQKKRKARFEYVRPALQLGLGLEQKLGVNPFKFGVIGSTDSHTGLATADEANFWGKSAPAEPSELRIFNGRAVFNWQMSASGYAGVWAHENTRKSIFLALQRRETYATTGPRMRIRMFAGFDFDDADLTAPDIAKIGYEKGVPMGGDLLPRSAKDRRSPTFLLSANKDPEGANLDRVQIVKGWIENGNARERVYNAILGGDRRLDSDGKASAVGNSVDQDNATYENNIGQAQLLGIWQDPDFNPEVASVYYMRVLQIPTPRWTLYDKVRYQLKDLAEQIPMIIQERAYSSAIWYTPRAKKNNKYGLLPIMENEQ
jgi:hypothetical protein